jgi:hypothetical protein
VAKGLFEYLKEITGLEESLVSLKTVKAREPVEKQIKKLKLERQSRFDKLVSDPAVFSEELELNIRAAAAKRLKGESIEEYEVFFDDLIKKLWEQFKLRGPSRALLQPPLVPIYNDNGTVRVLTLQELEELIKDNIENIAELSANLGFRFSNPNDPNSIRWAKLTEMLGLAGGRPLERATDAEKETQRTYATTINLYKNKTIQINGTFNPNNKDEYMAIAEPELMSKLRTALGNKATIKFLLNFSGDGSTGEHAVVITADIVRKTSTAGVKIFGVSIKEWDQNITYNSAGQGPNPGLVAYNNKVYHIKEGINNTIEKPDNLEYWDELKLNFNKHSSFVIFKNQEIFNLQLAHVFGVLNNIFDSLPGQERTTIIPFLESTLNELSKSVKEVTATAETLTINQAEDKAVNEAVISLNKLITSSKEHLKLAKNLSTVVPRDYDKDSLLVQEDLRRTMAQNFTTKIEQGKLAYGTPIDFMSQLVVSDKSFIQVVANMDVTVQYGRINGGFQSTIEKAFYTFFTEFIQSSIKAIIVKGQSPSITSRLVMESLAKVYKDKNFVKNLKNTKKRAKSQLIMPLYQTKLSKKPKKNPKIKKLSAKNTRSSAKTTSRRSTTINSRNIPSITSNLNANIKNAVIAQMNGEALRNRSGKFASSVRILDNRQSDIIRYTYEKNPYVIFSQNLGKSPWNSVPQRDPTTIINKAILSLVGNKNIRTQVV